MRFRERDPIVRSCLARCEPDGSTQSFEPIDCIESSWSDCRVFRGGFPGDTTEGHFDTVLFEKASGRNAPDDVAAPTDTEDECMLVLKRVLEVSIALTTEYTSKSDGMLLRHTPAARLGSRVTPLTLRSVEAGN